MAAPNYSRVPEDEYELPLTQKDAASQENGDGGYHQGDQQTSSGPSQSFVTSSEKRYHRAKSTVQGVAGRIQDFLARTFKTRISKIAAGLAALLLLILYFSTGGAKTSSAWGRTWKGVAQGWGYSIKEGETITLAYTPHYDDPFNPDDLTFTEEQCDAYFPGLYADIDRSVKYYTEHPFTKEYLETSCDDGDWTHARVVVYNNRLYIKNYRQSDFTRSGAALALLHQALITSREPIPNVEFCMGLQDWGARGKFSLDRGPEDEEVWLMPDYGWWSWPEHVGSYSDIRMKMDNVERSTPWDKKVAKLFWRGSMKVGTADRESLVQAAAGHSWNDVKEVDWKNPVNAVTMEDHCKWKFQGFPEGNTYSGRLRYLQNCKTVIVTHPPRWIQHWTHLYNADWNSDDQNIVYVPHAIGDATGVVVHDGGKEYLDRTWERLNEVMEALIKDDDKARSIAENQWNYFRNRYISPASAVCYWRKAIKGFASVQKYDVDLSGLETSYESFVLKGMRNPNGTGHHRRDVEQGSQMLNRERNMTRFIY